MYAWAYKFKREYKNYCRMEKKKKNKKRQQAKNKTDSEVLQY